MEIIRSGDLSARKYTSFDFHTCFKRQQNLDETTVWGDGESSVENTRKSLSRDFVPTIIKYETYNNKD